MEKLATMIPKKLITNLITKSPLRSWVETKNNN